MTIRVVHVTESCRGGTAIYLSGLIAHQLAQPDRYEVHLVGCKDKLADEIRLWPNMTHYYDSSRSPLDWFRVARSINRILKDLDPDIVHSHGSFAGVFARTAGLAKNCRHVYCAHGWSFQQDSSYIATLVYMYIERFLARRTDAIVNISWDEARAARYRKVLARHNVVILHGTRDRLISGTKPIELEADKIHLCFFGRFDRQKGLDLIVDAWRRVNPSRVVLHLFGDFDRDQPENLKFPDGVQLHGWITNDRIDDYLSIFNALVVPSRWEGFGLVVIEAMRNGLAVIASARGALTELVMDGFNGIIFEPTQQEALDSILSVLDSDPGVRKKLETMGRHGRLLYESRHTLPEPFKRIDSLYRQVI